MPSALSLQNFRTLLRVASKREFPWYLSERGFLLAYLSNLFKGKAIVAAGARRPIPQRQYTNGHATFLKWACFQLRELHVYAADDFAAASGRLWQVRAGKRHCHRRQRRELPALEQRLDRLRCRRAGDGSHRQSCVFCRYCGGSTAGELARQVNTADRAAARPPEFVPLQVKVTITANVALRRQALCKLVTLPWRMPVNS